MVVQLLHVPAKKLDFPMGSPFHAEAAHQEDVGMDIVLSIQHITPEEGKADKDRWPQQTPTLVYAVCAATVSTVC